MTDAAAKCVFCDGLGGWIAAADPMHAGKWQRCGSCDGSGRDTPIVAADLPERPDESEWVEPASADVPEDEVRAALAAALVEAGGVRALARRTGLSPAYISRAGTGKERIAGDLARFLGFERVAVYRRIG